MKHLKNIFRTFLAILAAGLTTQGAYAQKVHSDRGYEPAYFDSVEVSLLTCQPHDEVYSLYGHTAIRYRDLHHGETLDAAFNYGVFDFNKKFFVLRFVFGITDYELGAFPFDIFCKEYRHFGSQVTEQVLNLTNEEKLSIRIALGENLLPENRVYRYNYFYNNCTTKARDIIEQCINGNVKYAGNQEVNCSFRELVHKMTDNHPWSRLGNDLLLGVMADQPITQRQQEFLPHCLMNDFDHARILTDGLSRPLVKERRVAVPAGVQKTEKSFPLTPIQCAGILSVFSLFLLLLEWRHKQTFLWWDLTLMTVTGTIGIILTLMLFSQHPTVNLNLLILLFNPLPFVFMRSVARRHPTRYWHVTYWLLLLFMLGGFLQHYPEEIYALALCLLMQCYANKRLKACK